MIPIVDEAAWQLVRLTLLVQMVVWQISWPMINDGSIRSKSDHIGKIEGARHVINSRPEELPSMVRKRLIAQGRIMLAVMVMVMTMAITSECGV